MQDRVMRLSLSRSRGEWRARRERSRDLNSPLALAPSPTGRGDRALGRAQCVQLIFILEQVLNGAARRRLLPADRARAVADLLARRHRQSGARRVLRDRRLSRGRARAAASASPARSSPRRCWSALIGIVIERLLFRRFYRSDPILSLLLTFGLAMVAEQGLRMIFGAVAAALLDAAGCCAARSSSAISSIRATA